MKTFTGITNNTNLMILDSSNLAFRYKHSKAIDFAGAYMQTVDSLRRSYKSNKLIIAGDMGSSSYRKNLYPDYKQNRKDKYANQTEEEKLEFEIFFTEVQHILSMYEEEGKNPVLRFPGVEADDIAAYIVSKRQFFPVEHIWLISSDKDWDLLINKQTSRFSFVTRKEITYDNWSDHYDFDIEEYISIKCLTGDAGDNVHGVPGIGPKKAISLVKEYGSTYDIIASLPIVSKYKYIAALNEFGTEKLLLNYSLMDLVTFSEEAIGKENCLEIDKVLEFYLNDKS